MKTSDPLPDIQKEIDKRGISITSAGVSRLRYPLKLKSGDSITQVDGLFELSVPVAKETRGVNMSRFLEFLADWSAQPMDQSVLAIAMSVIAARLESEGAFYS